MKKIFIAWLFLLSVFAVYGKEYYGSDDSSSGKLYYHITVENSSITFTEERKEGSMPFKKVLKGVIRGEEIIFDKMNVNGKEVKIEPIKGRYEKKEKSILIDGIEYRE